MMDARGELLNPICDIIEDEETGRYKVVVEFPNPMLTVSDTEFKLYLDTALKQLEALWWEVRAKR